MTVRRSLSTRVRTEIFSRAKGTCHICGGKIDAGQSWEVEHIRPLALGGEDALPNLAPAHAKCHAVKTRDDVARIAKAKRIEAVHRGFKPKSKRPMPGSRQHHLQKKLDGTVVDRATGQPVGSRS